MPHTGRHHASDKANHRTAGDSDGAATATRGRRTRRRNHLPLQLLTTAALAVDAVIHARLAHRYDLNVAGGLSQGDLFRIEAGAAALAAGLIMLTANRIAWALVLVIATSALAAVLVSTYVHVGQVGPAPDMYEPAWYAQKVTAAVAEAVGTITALGGLASGHRRGG